MVEVTIGIDIGTTSVKAVAADAEGRVLARTRIPHRLIVPEAGQMEHDAAQAWRRGPRRAFLAMAKAFPQARGVCVASMVPSMTAVDRRGIPRTPGLLYGDSRGANVKGSANPEGSFEAMEFVRWSAAQLPGARGYWPAPAVANFALCGEAVVDPLTAGTIYPLFDGASWDEAALAQVGARVDQMPRVAPAHEAAAKVGDMAMSSGAIDAMGEQLVAGADQVGDVLVICGTTLIVWAVTAEPVSAPGLWTLPGGPSGPSRIGGASNAGGLFLNWAASLLARARPGKLDPERIPVWLPYVRGERTPWHNPGLRASLHRLDLTHDASALRRAAFEAAGFVVRHHLDLAGVRPGRIVASGGGVRVEEWVDTLAYCTGVPVEVVAVPEGGALGAAWLARMAAGLETSLEEAGRWSRVARRVEPDPRWQAAAEERYAIFRAEAEAVASGR